jgi:hypothetical protein
MNVKPTLLGFVGAVTGAAVSVRQSPTIASGIAIIGGKTYRIGQVGSFVRIPQGYHDLYGIVSEIGASATPQALLESHDRGERWMTVQLVGEVSGGSFERGISQHPSVNDEVHLVVEEDLLRIYGTAENGQVVIGRLANAEGIPVRIDLDKLVTRHSAILGSTGTGKSTTVASLVRSIALGNVGDADPGFPSARILLLDIHGEYARALREISSVFRANATGTERPLHIPYWALEPTELLGFLMGRLEDRPLTQILDRICDYRTKRVESASLAGVDLSSMTAETPIPYSLKQLWLDLIDPEIRTLKNLQTREPALEAPGDAESLKAPKYTPHSGGNTAPFINPVGVIGIRRQLDQMRSRLLDRQYDFLLHPGPWEPKLDGTVTSDLGDLLDTWLGHDKPVTILDLSGIPSVVLVRLIGAILRIIFEAMFWGRDKSEGGKGEGDSDGGGNSRPMLVVMEEAHRYLGKDVDGLARSMVQRVVKEGRKFGIGAMIISQRPSEVDETILSQCGTFVALRLTNESDRSKVNSTLPDNLSGIVNSLPILRTGEAIVIGEAARLPIRCRITLPKEEDRPNSEDPEVAKNWRRVRIATDFNRVAASWRAQNPRWAKESVARTKLPIEEIEAMEREQVFSSTIISMGYDEASETLEVEFKNGGVYQYYNVPKSIYQQFIEAGSKGQFHHLYIKNGYPFSRV